MPRIEINLPYPPTVNTYYRNVQGKTLISAKGRQYRRDVATAVMVQCVALGLTGKLRMRAAVMFPDRRKRDIDNLGKALLDSMEKAGVYENDNQIRDYHIIDAGIERGGHVKVWLEPLDKDTSPFEDWDQ